MNNNFYILLTLKHTTIYEFKKKLFNKYFWIKIKPY
jgi:hypothetical protein